MSASLSTSSRSTSTGSTMGLQSSYTCATFWPGDDQVCSSCWSALVTHSPGTISFTYQYPPCLPKFGHLQFSTLSRHSINLETAGQGITTTKQVYVPASTCGQVRELVSYSRSQGQDSIQGASKARTLWMPKDKD